MDVMMFLLIAVVAVVATLVHYSGSEKTGSESWRPRSSTSSRRREQTPTPTTLEGALRLAEDRDPAPTLRHRGLEARTRAPAPEDRFAPRRDPGTAPEPKPEPEPEPIPIAMKDSQSPCSGSLGTVFTPTELTSADRPRADVEQDDAQAVPSAPTAPSLSSATSHTVYTPTSIYAGYTPPSPTAGAGADGGSRHGTDAADRAAEGDDAQP